jgi:peroxiredoxin Q/BCP
MLGISPQSVDSHERFAERHGLTVPLLSDPGKEVARAYGAVGPGGFIRRSVFLVDGGGIVRYRHVALFGLRYQDVGDLERAVTALP